MDAHLAPMLGEVREHSGGPLPNVVWELVGALGGALPVVAGQGGCKSGRSRENAGL